MVHIFDPNQLITYSKKRKIVDCLGGPEDQFENNCFREPKVVRLFQGWGILPAQFGDFLAQIHLNQSVLLQQVNHQTGLTSSPQFPTTVLWHHSKEPFSF